MGLYLTERKSVGADDLINKLSHADKKYHSKSLYADFQSLSLIVYYEKNIESFLIKKIKGGILIATLLEIMRLIHHYEKYSANIEEKLKKKTIKTLFKKLNDEEAALIESLFSNGINKGDVVKALNDVYEKQQLETISEKQSKIDKEKLELTKGIIDTIICVQNKSNIIEKYIYSFVESFSNKKNCMFIHAVVGDDEDYADVFLIRENSIISSYNIALVLIESTLYKIETNKGAYAAEASKDMFQFIY